MLDQVRPSKNLLTKFNLGTTFRGSFYLALIEAIVYPKNKRFRVQKVEIKTLF